MKLKLLSLNDVKLYCEYVNRHILESGYNDNIIFTVHTDPIPLKEFIEKNTKRWATPVGENGWGRNWSHFDGDKIISNVNLRCVGENSLHRAFLGIGIEFPYRKRGLGTILMDTAMEWVKDKTFLDYIDLSTYCHNDPAIKLFKKFGFKETSVKKDFIRINGQSIDELQMTLKL